MLGSSNPKAFFALYNYLVRPVIKCVAPLWNRHPTRTWFYPLPLGRQYLVERIFNSVTQQRETLSFIFFAVRKVREWNSRPRTTTEARRFKKLKNRLKRLFNLISQQVFLTILLCINKQIVRRYSWFKIFLFLWLEVLGPTSVSSLLINHQFRSCRV